MLSQISDIKDIIRNNIKIVQNTGYLTIIECVHLILPFVALPYIIHTVGMDRYGMVVFAQTIILYFNIFINFGFNISSVKDVALLRDNKKELNYLVSSVLTIKAILFLISFVVLLLCIAVVPKLSEYKTLLLYSFIFCLSEVLFPVWYFQGVEKMKYITFVKSSSILLYTISVFLFVRTKSDYEYVPLLQSLSFAFTGLIAFICLTKVEGVKLCIPPLKQLVSVFKNAIPFFFSRVSVVFNANLAKLVTGLFLSMESVAAFDIAQKLCQFVMIPVEMLNQAVYPHIARTRNRLFITKYLFLSALLGLSLSVVLFLVAPFLIGLFTNENIDEATTILRVLCLFTFSDTITIGLGACTLIAFGFPKPFNESVMCSTVFLSLLYVLIYHFELFSTTSFAFALFLTSLFVLLYRLYFCMKNSIFQFRMPVAQ